MIDVSEVINDPDFARDFTVERFSGSFANEGEYTATSTTLQRYGIIQPATAEDAINFLPEGERQKNLIRVWCTEEIRMGDGDGNNSDVVVDGGLKYRVAFAKRWQQNGYWFAIAVGFPAAAS